MSVELEQQEQLTIKYRVESQNNLEKVNELMVKNFSLQSDINRLERLARNPFDYIESLKEYNKESYMYAYLSICDMIEDAPERPQDIMSIEEYNMYCGIVEAEIGIGFDVTRSFRRVAHIDLGTVRLLAVTRNDADARAYLLHHDEAARDRMIAHYPELFKACSGGV